MFTNLLNKKISVWVALTTIAIVLLISTSAVIYADTITPNFPTSLNSWDDGDVIEDEDIEAIEAKIGINNSSVTSSLDYMLRATSSSIGSISRIATTTGNTIYSNGSKWIGLTIGSSGQLLTVSGGIPTWSTYTETDPIVKALTGIITSNGSTISAITDSHTNWDTAYSNYLQWSGTSTNLIAATGRASLGLGTMALANTSDYISTTTGLSYLTITSAAINYLSTSSASTNYISTTTILSYPTLTFVGNNYVSTTTGLTYLTSVSAATNYLSTSSASTNYLATGTAASTYVTRNDWTTIDNYPSNCSANGMVYGLADTLSCYSTTTIRSNLALVIGTNVQAYDANNATTGTQTMLSLTSVGTIATGTWQGIAIGDTWISSAATWNAKIGGSGNNNKVAYFGSASTITSSNNFSYDGSVSALSNQGTLYIDATTTLAGSTGNVGIRTTTPAYTLDVYGSARLGTSTASSLFFRGLSNFNNNFYIDTSGNVATGTWQGTPIAYNYGGTGTSTALANQYLWWGNGSGGLVQVASSTLAGAGGVSSLNTFTGALTIWGTSNQLTVTASGTTGIILSTPQNIHTGASPTFANLTITTNATSGTIITTGLATLNNAKIGTNFIIDSSGNASTTGNLVIGGISIFTGTSTFAGRVGIGTTTPNNLLQVYDLIDFNNADFNTKIGYLAGKNIAAGAGGNVFIGDRAGFSDAGTPSGAADYNTAMGHYSFYNNISGYQNTANGYYSLYGNTTGIQNTAVGVQSLQSNTAGNFNTGVGSVSLFSNSTGNGNTAIGYYSLGNTTGSSSVALGYFAGKYETGSNAFYVDNQNRTNTAGDKAGALLYGTFNATPASQTLTINASTSIANNLTVSGTITASPTLTGIAYFTAGVLGTSTASGVSSLNGISGVTIIAGTANQITVASSSQTITLSTPQSIGTASSPTFANLTITTNATASSLYLSAGITAATATITTVTGNLTGNAGTATALASNPTDCGAGTVARSIDASGNLTCSAVSLTADVSGILPYTAGGTGTSTALASQYLWWGNGSGGLVQIASSTLAGTGGGGISTTTPFSAGYIPYATSSSAITNSAIFQASDNSINIGTITPSTGMKLKVIGKIITDSYIYSSGNAATQILLASAGDFATIQNDTTDTWSLGSKNNTDLTLGTPALTWKRTGKVGIGTTTPAYTLDVYGQLRVNGTSTITTLNLINPLTYAYGGTGTSTALANQYLWWGNGSGGLVQVASSTLTGTGGGVASLNGITGAALIAGTANQITVASTSQTITLSTPQSIAVASSPTFANLTITTNATASSLYLSAGITAATATITTVTGNLTGNAGTATALASNPTDCGAGTVARSIDASGNLTCTAVDISADTNLAAGRSLTMSGDSVEADTELYTRISTFAVRNATSTGNPVAQHKYPTAITITRISCSGSQSTTTLQFDERSEATPNTAGTDVLSAALNCGNSTTSASTAFANAGIAANAILNLDIDAMTGGSTTTVNIHVEYVVND